MATNLNIDQKLLEIAQKLGGHATKRETVNEALREYITRRKQKDVLKLFGKLNLDPTYDYKAQRKMR